MLSSRAWIFVGICAIAAPLLLGVWPNSMPRLLVFVLLAWIGAFVSGAFVMVMGRQANGSGDMPAGEPRDDGENKT